jgi:phosphoribosylaminoimidazolecarboxamide formyltransferase/IMP cyclohydrolase
MKISRALLSVSDKTGIVEFAQFLHAKNIEIISTGGTAAAIRKKDIPVKDISEITNFPEMLDGRVKTLHPAIHGGLLYVRGNDDHEKTVTEHEIGAIDLVVVNLYPFEETVAKGAADEVVIENIDIGGPSMLRSAAKNFAAVTVVSDPADLEIVREQIEKNGGTDLETRRRLSGKVYERTAKYDAAIAKYFNPDITPSNPPQSPLVMGEAMMDLKYGENPHQTATLYRGSKTVTPSVVEAEVLQGKQMGYCNILDADAALNCVLEFTDPAAVIIKHATPCGVAVAKNIKEAFTKAFQADSTSAFGGIVAFNREVTGEVAEEMSKIFFEVIIAPKFSEEAKKIFAKKPNLRLLATEKMNGLAPQTEIKSVSGGFLKQDKDVSVISSSDLKHAVGEPTNQEISDMLFAWKVVKHVKSNAIVLVKNGVTVGIGGGQTSRVGSSAIAVHQAGEKAKGAVAASDAFFPFSDGVEQLAEAGISAIIQPGGSKGDEAVFAAAKEAGVKMSLTGMRVFKH